MTFSLEYVAKVPTQDGTIEKRHTVGWEIMLPIFEMDRVPDQDIEISLKSGNQVSLSSDLIWGNPVELKNYELKIYGVLSESATPPPKTDYRAGNLNSNRYSGQYLDPNQGAPGPKYPSPRNLTYEEEHAAKHYQQHQQ